MSDVQLLVGTTKGAFILDSGRDRTAWSLRGPLCEGWPIHDLIVEPSTGAILAAGGSPWYGRPSGAATTTGRHGRTRRTGCHTATAGATATRPRSRPYGA